MRDAADSSSEPRKATTTDAMLAARHGEVVFRDLPRAEIEEIISRNHVGRIAFAFHDRVDIQPISYVYERGWLYGRTSEGEKIATMKHNQWVAFEIDEIKDAFDWRSVVIHGSFWRIHPLGSPHAEDVWAKAADLVSKLVPGALTEHDPVAFRQILFRIAISDVRGRAAQRKGLS
ncbi:MAG TPA: pyridoxamine 5'-phosphate oxidase family protein [Gemmatimonadaceae bacterium]|nr:pyridoxamine 5'-phosphate oxidase family protein [Gemmatimonadaceae bacterium]